MSAAAIIIPASEVALEGELAWVLSSGRRALLGIDAP
jgi:hypothetical protein